MDCKTKSIDRSFPRSFVRSSHLSSLGEELRKQPSRGLTSSASCLAAFSAFMYISSDSPASDVSASSATDAASVGASNAPLAKRPRGTALWIRGKGRKEEGLRRRRERNEMDVKRRKDTNSLWFLSVPTN